MKQTVFAILDNQPQAEQVVERLKGVGFYPNDISMLWADTSGNKDLAIEHETKMPEGTAAGGTAGFVIGGALGWLVGLGTLAIPGLGPFIAAGPLMAALSGAAVGAAAGGIVGGLVGMGMPEFEARRYESKIKEGGILISVHTEDSGGVERAKKVLMETRALHISTAGEAHVPEGKMTT